MTNAFARRVPPPPMRFFSRLRCAVGCLARALSGTVVALVLLEIASRLAPFLPITSMGAVLRADPILDHSLRPGTYGRMRSDEYDVWYRVNPWGLRDDAPEPGAVLILGDSFMEGYGVEQDETVAAKLEAMGIPTVNAGVKSYSPLLEYLYLKHRGLALRPDTVLLFLDLSDPVNDRFYARRLVRGEDGEPIRIRPRRLKVPTIPGAPGDFLEAHSFLYANVLHKLHKHFPATEADAGYAGLSAGEDLLFAARESVPDTAYWKRWDVTWEAIGRIRDLCRAEGIDFALVTYPYGHQVSPDAWSKGRKAHGFPPGVSSPDRPFRFLEAWGARQGIPVLSLDRYFRSHPDPASLYYDYDGHWTPEGHRFVAEVVAEFLRAGLRQERH